MLICKYNFDLGSIFDNEAFIKNIQLFNYLLISKLIIMKKYLLSILIFGFCLSLTAQSQESEKTFKHEIGFDATSLIGRVMVFGGYGFYSTSYQPTYYVNYRAHIGEMRLRAGIGGNYQANNSEVKTENSQIDYRIGAEFSTEISKRFELYYGLDAVGGSNRDYREWEYVDEYLLAFDYSLDYVGIAPFLGVRFKVTDKISLMAELSAIFRREEVKDNNYTKEVLVENPIRPEREENFDEYTQTRILYTAPDFIVLSFML